MAGDPYCGNCHTWMYPLHGAAGGTVWMCECPVGQADLRKDPNCHNDLHEHHDPDSPIVLSRRAIDEAEERAEAEALSRRAMYEEEERLREEAIRPFYWELDAADAEKHKYHVAVFDSATGELLGWRPLNEPEIDEETRAALDAILREANEQETDGWRETYPGNIIGGDRPKYLQERADD